MGNQALKQVFQDMHSAIASRIDPDSVIDALFSREIIGTGDYYRLRQVADSCDRCRDMLSLLHQSAHPQAFIHLRLALHDEYSMIVDEIDSQLTSLTYRLQQLQLCHSTDGKLLLHPHARAYTHRLMVIFSGIPAVVGCHFDFVTRGLGAKFYRLDVLPDANQQNYTGLRLFCIRCNSWREWPSVTPHLRRLSDSKTRGKFLLQAYNMIVTALIT